MAPSQLKTYLETIVNSTLYPRDNEASLHDAYGNMDYGNALPIRLDFKDSHNVEICQRGSFRAALLPIVCAMTTPSSELRREILEFGQFPEKFFRSTGGYRAGKLRGR